MICRESARLALRAATATFHDSVDRIFSHAALGDRAGYGRFLQAQAAAHLPVEAALGDGGADAVLPDWPQRRRAALLRADLAMLGLAVPEGGAAPVFASPAAVLGGVYVLEGSRLGGALLRRSVPPAFPTGFLGASDPGSWRRLLALLDARLGTTTEIDRAIAAACAVFAVFERSGRQFLKVD